MSLVLITPPADLPLTLAELKAQVRIEGLDDGATDALVMGYLRAAVADVDGRDGILQRALITQTWELKLDCFPFHWRRSDARCWRRDPIRLPLPPLQSVTSINYVDLAGAEQTLDPSRYQVTGVDGRLRAEVVPAYGFEWPDTREDTPEAVRVRFVAGYGDTANDVPEPIRHALMIMVAEMYCDREGEMGVPAGAMALLDGYRVVSL